MAKLFARKDGYGSVIVVMVVIALFFCVIISVQASIAPATLPFEVAFQPDNLIARLNDLTSQLDSLLSDDREDMTEDINELILEIETFNGDAHDWDDLVEEVAELEVDFAEYLAEANAVVTEAHLDCVGTDAGEGCHTNDDIRGNHEDHPHFPESRLLPWPDFPHNWCYHLFPDVDDCHPDYRNPPQCP